MSIDHASALNAASNESSTNLGTNLGTPLEKVGASSHGRVKASWGGAARGAEFLTSSERSARCRELADEGYLVARVVPMFDAKREPIGLRPSELRNALEGAVEISLALRGALPPAVDVGAPVDESVVDQLDRLRRLGAPGLCLVLPELMRIANGNRCLSADDSAALYAWHKQIDDQPVVLLLDEGDHAVTMLAPMTLEEMFPAAYGSPTSWPEDARSLLDQTPHGGVQVAVDASLDGGWEDEDEDERVDESMAAAASSPTAETASASHASFEEDEEDDDDIAEAIELASTRDRDESMLEAPTRPGRRLMARDPLAGLDLDDDGPMIEDDDAVERSLFEPSGRGRSSRGPLHHHSHGERRSHGDRRSHGSAEAARAAAPREPLLPRAEIERLTTELENAQGPKPVSAIQELFATRYTPLLEVLSAGYDDPRVERVVDNWRESFEKSYGEGFNTMRVTGRRPSMVLDAPDIASKIAKVNGARAAQLLLVDGMRYDLSRRVHRELTSLLQGQAQCVDESVLWSALPSVTPVQLHLLARGPRGLKEEPHSEREPTIHRDGSLTTLRRVRIGQRDLMKLDLVEARLREAGPGFETRMSALAEEVADVIAGYAAGLPPRTLLFVFGDHGFYMPTGGPDATGPADQGNATPEEVLCGAQAWLTGPVH